MISRDLYARLGRRPGRTAFTPPALEELMSAVDDAGATVDDAADSAQLPEVPEAPTRKPLGAVAQSTPATVSGDDNDERGLLRDLSSPITTDERAALNDPRASAGQQDMRQSFDRMSNVFLTSAGLPALQREQDPYVSERDKLRQWVMQRGGVARGNETSAQNSERTKAYLASTQAQRERDMAAQKERALADGRKADAEKFDQQLKAEQAKREERKADEDARHNKAMEGIGWKNATRPAGGAAIEVDEDGNIVPRTTAERRQKLREDALKPRPGWEPIEVGRPTFRDTDEGKRFDSAAAAFGALQNHRKHAAEAMAKFRNAKTLAEKDDALAVVNQQMANIASKLRVAEGLNNSDAANAAVDHMLSLKDGSVANLRNIANEGRLDAILDSAIESARTNLDTLGAANNIRRSGGDGAGSSDDAAALKWAKENPNDSRAAQILKLHGAK